VQEIRGFEACTRLANSPNFVKGVINLRGTIVPILDMRLMFGVRSPTYDALTVVIILNIGANTVGVVVDSVKDVVSLLPEQIRPAPDVRTGLKADALIGIGTVDGSMLILLDIEKVMCASDIGMLERIAA